MTETTPTETTKNKPLQSFQNGDIQATIFNNKLQDTPDKYVIKIDKRTKKPGENFHRSTRYYTRAELLNLSKIVLDAEKYVRHLPS